MIIKLLVGTAKFTAWTTGLLIALCIAASVLLNQLDNVYIIAP